MMKNLACKICSAFVISLVALLFILPGFAEEGTKSELFTYEIKGNGTAKITSFNWKGNGSEDLYIPRMLDGYTVTEIGNDAFAKETPWKGGYESSPWGLFNTSSNKIAAILPDTITTIGDRAFFNCDNIATINIPASVQVIGEGAFSYTGIKCSIDVNNTYFATIDNILYEKKTKKLLFCPRRNTIDQLVIPDGIEIIGGYAFYNAINSDLLFSGDEREAVLLPNTIKEIGDYAFYGCGLEAFAIPDSVTKIGDYAFSHSSFASRGFAKTHTGKPLGLYLPASVKQLGEGVFEGWKSASVIYLQDTSIESIPRRAFANCGYSLDQICFPSTLTTIEDEAFYGTEIDDLSINEGVETIGNEAFYGGKLPTIVALPSTVKTIGDRAFNDAKGLETLVLPSSISSIGKDLCDRTQVTLQVESGSYAAIWASENGYPTTGAGGDDTSWLTE